MIILRPLFLFAFCFYLHISVNAQTISTIDDMAKLHQQCLDSGIDMKGCSRNYYLQMDSMLNVAYNKLHSQLSSSEKTNLRSEQLAWLKKRDIYFKKQDNILQRNIKNGTWGTDMVMINYDDKAEYVKIRVITLIKSIH